MKTHPKYIMGPLIFGGLILSLFLSLLIYRIRSAGRVEKAAKPHKTLIIHSKPTNLSYCTSIIEKLFLH
jgi:hypothetical protein